ncbi:FKBP-type peptidyl-prolyl cis-trans isomerase [Arthrobacter sp. Marseille-P9274]|nr:FKBP-type peptidyl-prolyl cis-trans isomerase [Arthrobacter sp. Marseille-P9274]
MRKILTMLLPAALLLTACGSAGQGSDSLDDVTVTPEKAGAAPAVEFEAPLELPETTAQVLESGSGEGAGAVDGQWLRFHYVAYDAVTGEAQGDTFSTAEQTLQLNAEMKKADAGLYDALEGAKAGDQVGYYLKPQAAAGASSPAQHPQLLVLSIGRVKDGAAKADAKEVAELEKAGKLPKVTLDGKGVPSVKIPEGTDAPDNLIVQVLDEGDGKEATAESTVKANYAGWNWSEGKEFDSSFSRGEPTEFPLSGVIPGWTQGLTGLKEGAKVVLTIPTELAYVQGQGDASGDLVFYVELTEVK